VEKDEHARIAAAIFRRLGLTPGERLSAKETAALDALYAQFRRDVAALAEGVAPLQDSVGRSADDRQKRAQRSLGARQRQFQVDDGTKGQDAVQDPMLASAVDETRRRMAGSLDRRRAQRALDDIKGDGP
jgi:hypothetical protein